MIATTLRARLVLVAALVATTALPWATASRADGARVVAIEIRGFKFVTESPRVRPGDVVLWRNMDIVPHTAAAKDGSWISGKIAAKAEWQTVATADMSGYYYCKYHPSMVATLEVESK